MVRFLSVPFTHLNVNYPYTNKYIYNTHSYTNIKTLILESINRDESFCQH